MTTRANIRDRARVRADQDSSTFPTDAQYNDLIDSSAKDVWYDLVHAGWPINYTSVDKTATGTNPLTLGASGTVAFIRGVFYISGGTVYELQRLNEGDRASLMSLTGQAQASHYDVRIDPTSGPVIELLPLPSAGTYRIHYITEYPGFSGDSDTWYGPARSDELIILRAAMKGCRKEGNDQGAAQLEREYGQLLEKVQEMGSWFNMRSATLIRDVGRLQEDRRALRLPFDYDF